MARIAGIVLPEHKKIEIALTSIYGIGRNLSRKILLDSKVNPDLRVSEVPESEIESIRNLIEKSYSVEGELRMKVNQNIKRLKAIQSYRGDRHSRRLPVRGQRTKTNARTKRGKRVTVGSGRKTSAEKT